MQRMLDAMGGQGKLRPEQNTTEQQQAQRTHQVPLRALDLNAERGATTPNLAYRRINRSQTELNRFAANGEDHRSRS